MRLPKEIYRFIEYEMFNYENYKRELELERERILESYSGSEIGIHVKGGQIKNETLDKTIKLNLSRNLKSMSDSTAAVDTALKMLGDNHRNLFKQVYINGRRDIYSICMELSISDRTYWNYKRELITSVAGELGLIPLMP